MRRKTRVVGIDFHQVGRRKKSGVANYTVSLADELARARPAWRILLLVDRAARPSDVAAYSAPPFRVVRIPFSHPWPYYLMAQVLCLWNGVDVVMFPATLIPRVWLTKTAITVHDLTYEKYPEFYDGATLRVQKTKVPESCRKATVVLADSASTRADVIDCYGLPPDKVVAVLLPVRRSLPQGESSRHAGDFVLTVGNIQPRKNLVRLVEAFAGIAGSVRLVIVGNVQSRSEHDRLTNAIAEHELARRVSILGHVSDSDLHDLYARCLCVAFPSMYEGFGYPVIEAFAHGAPVLTSNVSSLPEVAGDAALYVDPLSVESVRRGLQQLVDDRGLREALAERGRARLDVLAGMDFGEATAGTLERCFGP